MKVFDVSNGCWDDKVNFVDENNVFVGYDMGQACCEDAGWFISDSITPYTYSMETIEFDIEEYSFDKEFFESPDSPDLDEGGMAVFKLLAEGKPDLFLHLYNAHNGYYGHGFEVLHDGLIVNEGGL